MRALVGVAEARVEGVADAAAKPRSRSLERSVVRDWAELTKLRIAVLVLVTVAVGAFVAAGGAADPLVLLNVSIGTALLAAGSSALNQVIERETDARMARTEARPVVTGRIPVRHAAVAGLALGAAGAAWLLAAVNPLTALLGALTYALYVGAYTPLKTRSAVCTIVGAIPGAMPPLLGWTAVTERLDPGAFILFGIVFLWQFPHFLAIAWMYRDDYARAGLQMLTTRDATGALTARQMIVYGLALVPVSLAPSLVGMAGATYFVGALVLSLVFLALSVGFALRATRERARYCLLTSLVYLPALLSLLMIDLSAAG